MSEQANAYYLYCFAPAGCERVLRHDDVIAEGWNGITALISEVPREEFCSEEAEARLRDLAWLAPRVSRHEAVVEQVMLESPVFPARFATLFGSMESLHQYVAAHHDAIIEFLKDFGGQHEWAVKGMLLRDAGKRGETALSGRQSGHNYLARKRLEAAARKDSNRRLKARVQEAALALQQRSSGFRERQVWKQGGDEGAHGEMVVNWAFLLREAAEGDFRHRVEEQNEKLGSDGLSLILTGPWPPYTFVPVLDPGAAP